jgi:uncharacterized membrane protein
VHREQKAEDCDPEVLRGRQQRLLNIYSLAWFKTIPNKMMKRLKSIHENLIIQHGKANNNCFIKKYFILKEFTFMLKEFTSLHPLTVHFPIGLIVLAFVFQAVIVWKPGWTQIRWATLFIMAGAFLSAWAVSTVFHAEFFTEENRSAQAVFNEHDKYAKYTLWMAGITFLLKSAFAVFKLNRRLFHSVVLVAATFTLFFLYKSGEAGAKLTYIEGAPHNGEENEGEGESKEGSNGMKNKSDMDNPNNEKPADEMKGMDSNE